MTEWFANHILGMPELASQNGQAVDALIVYVHWLMLALFIGWTIYFAYAVWRFQANAIPRPITKASKATRRALSN